MVEDGQFSDGIKKNFTSQDFRFTTANGYLYATALKSSENGEYVITSLGEQDASKHAHFHGIIKSVDVLGTDVPLQWRRRTDGLHIHTKFTNGEFPVVFRIGVD